MKKRYFMKVDGICPICSKKVKFIASNEWLREHFKCSSCGSIPRERALMVVLETYFPGWRHLVIHESSPSNRGASVRLAEECSDYIPSQYFVGRELGSLVNGVRCENLEELSFSDGSIDIHITQDVMEHIFHPAKAFREIARTLKPGGAHIFTVPLVNKKNPSRVRAKIDAAGNIEHLHPPVYHWNPIDTMESLVTVDWGFDICQYIFESSGLFTLMIQIDDITKGIRAEYIEVLMTYKYQDAANALLPITAGDDALYTRPI
jgi:SAM-dependent methyltransferase